MKILTLLTTLCFYSIAMGQVGVNTKIPNSFVNVNGSFAGNIKEINTNYTLTDQDFYVVYSTASNQNSVITLPEIPSTTINQFKGRIYQIKNASNQTLEIQVNNSTNDKMRIGNSDGISTFTLSPGSYTEIVNTGLTGSTNTSWDVMYISNPTPPTTSNVIVKTGQLSIPPLIATNFNVNTFNSNNVLTDIDNKRWILISKSNKPFSRYTDTYYGNPFMIGYDISSLELVYEYTGTALTVDELDNVQPIITTGNNLSVHSDIFVASFNKIENVNGKTRINIKVTRADKIGYQNPNNQLNDTPSGETSDWEGNFIMNLILAIKN